MFSSFVLLTTLARLVHFVNQVVACCVAHEDKILVRFFHFSSPNCVFHLFYLLAHLDGLCYKGSLSLPWTLSFMQHQDLQAPDNALQLHYEQDANEVQRSSEGPSTNRGNVYPR